MISKLFKVQDGAEESFAVALGSFILIWFWALVLIAWGGLAVVSFIRMEFIIPEIFTGWKMYRIFAVVSVALSLYNVLKKGDDELRYMWDAEENRRRNRSMAISEDTKKLLEATKKTREAVEALNTATKR